MFTKKFFADKLLEILQSERNFLMLATFIAVVGGPEGLAIHLLVSMLVAATLFLVLFIISIYVASLVDKQDNEEVKEDKVIDLPVTK